MKEKIRMRKIGDLWVIEVLSNAVHKWLVMAEWPTTASCARDLKVWMDQGCFEHASGYDPLYPAVADMKEST